jgi:hypothetical protein
VLHHKLTWSVCLLQFFLLWIFSHFLIELFQIALWVDLEHSIKNEVPLHQLTTNGTRELLASLIASMNVKKLSRGSW